MLRLHSPEPAPDLRRLLENLEIPDCDCLSDDGPCDHSQAFVERFDAETFPMTIAEWQELLVELDADEYTDPLPPMSPALAMSRAAVVAVYESRLADGVGLYHPRDSWRDREAPDGLGISVHRARNGSVEEDGIATTRREAA
jgi:hypothetical protein